MKLTKLLKEIKVNIPGKIHTKLSLDDWDDVFFNFFIDKTEYTGHFMKDNPDTIDIVLNNENTVKISKLHKYFKNKGIKYTKTSNPEYIVVEQDPYITLTDSKYFEIPEYNSLEINEIKINKPGELRYDDLIKELYDLFDEDPNNFADWEMYSHQDIYEGYYHHYLIRELPQLDKEKKLDDYYKKHKKIVMDGNDYTKEYLEGKKNVYKDDRHNPFYLDGSSKESVNEIQVNKPNNEILLLRQKIKTLKSIKTTNDVQKISWSEYEDDHLPCADITITMSNGKKVDTEFLYQDDGFDYLEKWDTSKKAWNLFLGMLSTSIEILEYRLPENN